MRLQAVIRKNLRVPLMGIHNQAVMPAPSRRQSFQKRRKLAIGRIGNHCIGLWHIQTSFYPRRLWHKNLQLSLYSHCRLRRKNRIHQGQDVQQTITLVVISLAGALFCKQRLGILENLSEHRIYLR